MDWCTRSGSPVRTYPSQCSHQHSKIPGGSIPVSRASRSTRFSGTMPSFIDLLPFLWGNLHIENPDSAHGLKGDARAEMNCDTSRRDRSNFPLAHFAPEKEF